jgi:hypothetical protein
MAKLTDEQKMILWGKYKMVADGAKTEVLYAYIEQLLDETRKGAIQELLKEILEWEKNAGAWDSDMFLRMWHEKMKPYYKQLQSLDSEVK